MNVMANKIKYHIFSFTQSVKLDFNNVVEGLSKDKVLTNNYDIWSDLQ